MSYAANFKFYSPHLPPPMPNAAPDTAAELEWSQAGASPLGKLALPTMDGIYFKKIKNILYLEACGNYTYIHFKDKKQILVCKTLRDVESALPDTEFVRIHRSHAINLRHIKKYIRGKGGQVVLTQGITLVVSSGQKDLFIQSLKRFFGG